MTLQLFDISVFILWISWISLFRQTDVNVVKIAFL